jgi:hypothetical protein
LLQTLIPDELRFDLAMNIFTFSPGHGLPIIETHVMEHGALILQGKGVYYLGGEWMEVEAATSSGWARTVRRASTPRHGAGEVHLLQERQPRDRTSEAGHSGARIENIHGRQDLPRCRRRRFDPQGKTIAVIGYGIQGKAQAANARDSGFTSSSAPVAARRTRRQMDSRTYSIADATKRADMLLIELADPVQPTIYTQRDRRRTAAGQTLCFCHGFSVLYGQIVPPKDVNCVLYVPNAPGKFVRAKYARVKASTAASASTMMRQATRERSASPSARPSAARERVWLSSLPA